jgi:hypothetical protein
VEHEIPNLGDMSAIVPEVEVLGQGFRNLAFILLNFHLRSVVLPDCSKLKYEFMTYISVNPIRTPGNLVAAMEASTIKIVKSCQLCGCKQLASCLLTVGKPSPSSV